MSETASTPDSTTSTSAPSSSAEPTPAPAPQAPASDSVTPSSGSPDSTPSPSSGDSRRSDREELLAAVLKVVPTKPETSAIPTEGDTAVADQERTGEAGPDQVAAQDTGQGKPPDQTAPTQDQQDKDEPDPTEGELRKLRPETRRRFERLLEQRNLARQELAAITPELTAHRQLQGYLQQHRLAADDVNRLLGVGSALRRGDFQAFLDGVTPYVMVAQEALGYRIAPDLQKQVEEGTLSEVAARDMTRTRHRANRAEHELGVTRQQQQADAQTRNVVAVRDAVDAWEADTRTRDPDYGHKADAVRRYSQALMQERGLPATPVQAVELVKAAYDEATRFMLRMRPTPQPTRPRPSGVQTSTNGAAANTGREPASMKDAVLTALANMRRAS